LAECAAPEVRFEDIVSHLLEPRFGASYRQLNTRSATSARSNWPPRTSLPRRNFTQNFRLDHQRVPDGAKDFYTTFEIDGRDVAAVYTLRPEQQARGVPAHWSLYVAVENADTAADRARGLGAKVIAKPFDVYDVGRMAVVQDPTGAVFSMWQAKRHNGSVLKAFPVHSVWLT
jgi:predicted enzyme related to lactoylglutathione lyase